MILAILAGKGADAPVGLGVHALKAALCHLAPRGDPLKCGFGNMLKTG